MEDLEFYDQNGEKIGLKTALDLLQTDLYREETVIPRKKLTVRTEFVCFNLNLAQSGPPSCYQTTVFDMNDPKIVYPKYRTLYSTEKEAKEGHLAMVKKLRRRLR